MTRIWVEGHEDVELIEALLVDEGLNGFDVLVQPPIGGWTQFEMARNELEKVTFVGGQNLLVFDADHPPEGGHTTRHQALLAKLESLELTAEVFLFPDDQSDGAIENLMLGLVPARHKPVMDCFDDYESCISGLAHPDLSISYRSDLLKTKAWTYVHAMPLTAEQRKAKQKRGSTKFFSDESIWDLGNAMTDPLRTFLRQHVR